MLAKSIETFQKPNHSLNTGHPQPTLDKAGSTRRATQNLLAPNVVSPAYSKTLIRFLRSEASLENAQW